MMRKIGLTIMGCLLGLLMVQGFVSAATEADRERLLKAKGQVPAEVVRVIDADTVVVNAEPWPDVIISKISVRINAVDTPEKAGSGCVMHYRALGQAVPEAIKQQENRLGCAATAFVAGSDKLKRSTCKALRDSGAIPKQPGLLRPGDWVVLRGLKAGKYAQRVVGEMLYPIADDKGGLVLESLGDRLIRENLAVPYDGGTKDAWWCSPIEGGEGAGISR
ncbi:hypothetical protein [uncultured Cohaesibacter sp.]|uniref:hypothetical protein n=1 Tax=uncultured Cohaesibacter sp. TaxID=1002546 RepID=UPI0029C704FA|nr:hypothetical protein [uncultured Cohaesibacter sp.]